MFRRKIYLLLLVAVLACTAQGQFISSVVRTGNSTQPAPTLAPNPMDEDELTFNDRTHQWNDVPLEMVDAQYVLTSNSDKTTTQYTLTVTM